MIKKISISGYKSIKELKDFELRPLNVLIGPNKGGKSNFLDFFALLKEAASGKLSEAVKRRGGITSILWAGGENRISTNITLQAPWIDSSLFQDTQTDFDYSITITADFWPQPRPEYSLSEHLNGNDIRLTFGNLSKKAFNKILSPTELVISQDPVEYIGLLFPFGQINVYRWFNVNYDAPMRLPQVREPETSSLATLLGPNGDNLSTVYYNLFQTPQYSENKDEIENILKRVFPDFDGIFFPSDLAPNQVALRWKETHFEKGRGFWPYELSDGTLRFLCLLAILFNPNPGMIICIDEPEVGLHPELVKIVAGLLKQASERMQLIVATHSPQLVSQLDPEDIVIVEAEDGASQFKRLNKKDWVEWLKDFTLGELWETGHIGGRL